MKALALNASVDLANVKAEVNVLQWVLSQTVGENVSTLNLSGFMADFGGFPSNYFLREEVVKLLEVILLLWKIHPNHINKPWSEKKCDFSDRPLPIVLQGSPGIGKSTISVLLTFYLYSYHNDHIFLIRKVDKVGITCLFFSKDNGISGMSFSNFSAAFIHYYSLMMKPGNPLLFLDGFKQDEIPREVPVTFLSTSAQYSWKSGDPSCLALLPAWKEASLSEFAGKNSSIVDASLVSHVYPWSGGDLRTFLKGELDAKNLATSALHEVTALAAVTLVSSAGGKADNNIDRIRKAFLKNTSSLLDYISPGEWYYVMDASDVVRRVAHLASLSDFEKMLDWSEILGGSLYGCIFELYVHKLASENRLKMRWTNYPVKLAKDDLVHVFEDVSLMSGRAEKRGSTDVEFVENLVDFGKDTDWTYAYSEHQKLKTIDYVGKMERSDKSKVVVHGQITISATHDIDVAALLKYDAAAKIDCLYPSYYTILVPRIELLGKPCEKGNCFRLNPANPWMDDIERIPLKLAYLVP